MKKTIATLTLSLMIAGAAQAADAPKTNQHQSRDQRHRACNQLADNQQLSGDARSAFIASCVKGK
jgi:ABC-type transporter MlaC component